MTDSNNIRNFAIIAHIDHGKTTLSDCIIKECGGLEQREMSERVLDNMPLEQERGITIKAQTVRLKYKADDGQIYCFNLIDTPGHVDFGYEVSRALAACDGSLLVVDASQGVEAQTLANVYQAIDNNHEIVVVLNKIDLPAADPEKVKAQIEDIIGIEAENALMVSAKNNIGIKETLEAIVHRLPAPKGTKQAPLKALIIDSWYDSYLGVVILARIVDGELKKGTKIKMMSNEYSYIAENIGVFTPKKVITDYLSAGDVGFITGSFKDIAECKVGDTITTIDNPAKEKLPGFKPSLPVVFCGLYPVDASDFEKLKMALAKLKLNDAAFEFEMETSTALGFGFRCGFLGLLHLDIIHERLSREYDLDLITTAPSVIYKVHLKIKSIIEVHNPSQMPPVQDIEYIEEPWIQATIFVPDEFVGAVLGLCTEKRGIQVDMTYVGMRAMLIYKLPLNEVVFDFHDRLKSCSRGYASFDWIMDGYMESDVVKLSILINSEPVDALAMIVHKTRAESRGRELCVRLKDLIPRQLYQIAIQAAIGGRVIARETIKAFRKDVTAKCYGGDITRKRKLLEKQKEGKKRMRSVGNIEIPHSAFIEALKVKDN